MEVRFPVEAGYGLGAVACSCMALDREDVHNWCLFSRRVAGISYEERKRQGQIFSEMLPPLIHSHFCGAKLSDEN